MEANNMAHIKPKKLRDICFNVIDSIEIDVIGVDITISAVYIV